MLKKILFFAIILSFAACNSGKFKIEGKITDAGSKILYFERAGLLKDSLIDSVKLNEEGIFKFSSKKFGYPELYRLRVGNQQLILGIDTTESIEINGSATDLISSKITGSKQSEDIQKLRKSVVALQKQVDELKKEKETERLKALADTLQVNLDKHKKFAQGIILTNPGSMASYFALYQQINGNYIFSPYTKAERPYYQAVATTFHTFMPEYDRSKNLYNLVISALKEDRMARKQVSLSDLAEVKTAGFIDIELNNVNGYPQKLSSFIGKPILLDFSAYSTETSIDHTFALREIYDKYAPNGLQIYQVSVDQNKLIWEHAVSNIPWTCVYDATGAAANSYNIQQIPTLFLISKEGNILGKYGDVKSMETALGKIL